MTMPPAVARKIAARTGLDPRIGRRARAGVCDRCHDPIVTGLDDDRCALTAHADPYRINALGELLALAAGRATYVLDGQPAALTYRHRWHITARGADKAFVLAEHACGSPALPRHPDTLCESGGAGGKTTTPENPPF